MLRAVVVDDERLARVELRALLAAEPDVHVVGEAASLDEAVAVLRRERPDLVFLDIQLGRESGFDLLARTDVCFELVFVTAFERHAVRAFEINAVDYLLKPIDPARLGEAVRRAAGGRAGKRRSGRNPGTWDPEDRLFVRAGGRWRFLVIRDIAAIEAAGDYTHVRTVAGEGILLDRPLREWELRLPSSQFARIHRGTLVNLGCVEQVDEREGGTFRVRVRGVPEPYAMSRRHAARLKG